MTGRTALLGLSIEREAKRALAKNIQLLHKGMSLTLILLHIHQFFWSGVILVSAALYFNEDGRGDQESTRESN